MTFPSSSTLLDQINTAVIRLDAKVDHILEALKDLKAGHQDHEMRIRLLENTPRVPVAEFQALKDSAVTVGTMWKLVGAALTIAGLAFTGINMIIGWLE